MGIINSFVEIMWRFIAILGIIGYAVYLVYMAVDRRKNPNTTQRKPSLAFAIFKGFSLYCFIGFILPEYVPEEYASPASIILIVICILIAYYPFWKYKNR